MRFMILLMPLLAACATPPCNECVPFNRAALGVDEGHPLYSEALDLNRDGRIRQDDLVAYRAVCPGADEENDTP